MIGWEDGWIKRKRELRRGRKLGLIRQSAVPQHSCVSLYGRLAADMGATNGRASPWCPRVTKRKRTVLPERRTRRATRTTGEERDRWGREEARHGAALHPSVSYSCWSRIGEWGPCGRKGSGTGEGEGYQGEPLTLYRLDYTKRSNCPNRRKRRARLSGWIAQREHQESSC